MLAGISIPQLLIILAIVVAIFGTKKLRGTGKDLGTAVKDFRSAMREGENEDTSTPQLKTGSTQSNTEKQTEEDKA